MNRYVAAPDLKVTEPAEGAKVPDARVRIAGTFTTGRTTDRVEVNGETVPVAGGAWQTTIDAKTAGAKSVTIRVVDGDEERAKVVRRFVVEEKGAIYAAYLRGFAVAVGTDLDAATGYPKRVRRLKDDGEMVLIPAGMFQMGAVPGDDQARTAEAPSRGDAIEGVLLGCDRGLECAVRDS